MLRERLVYFFFYLKNILNQCSELVVYFGSISEAAYFFITTAQRSTAESRVNV